MLITVRSHCQSHDGRKIQSLPSDILTCFYWLGLTFFLQCS